MISVLIAACCLGLSIHSFKDYRNRIKLAFGFLWLGFFITILLFSLLVD
jgi:hypothetical protein